MVFKTVLPIYHTISLTDYKEKYWKQCVKSFEKRKAPTKIGAFLVDTLGLEPRTSCV